MPNCYPLISGTFKFGFLATILALLSAHATSSDLKVFPASGTYLDKNQFDLTFIAQTPGDRIQHLELLLNGIPAPALAERCSSAGTTEQGFPYIQCKSLSGAALGSGPVHLEAVSHTNQGGTLHAEAQYEILSTALSYSYTFDLPTSSPKMMNLTSGYTYTTTASGEAILWAENPNFPVSSPSGNGTTCNTGSCLVPGAPTGALVVKIGPGNWNVLGTHGTFHLPYPEDVIFAVNDRRLEDNIGAYQVNITRVLQ